MGIEDENSIKIGIVAEGSSIGLAPDSSDVLTTGVVRTQVITSKVDLSPYSSPDAGIVGGVIAVLAGDCGAWQNLVKQVYDRVPGLFRKFTT